MMTTTETKYNAGDYVRIFETVTGNEYGENATIVRFDDGEQKYIVRTVDGALFSGDENQLRLICKG